MSFPNISLTQAQEHILKRLKSFITESNDRVFVLKGYAGTGKTTLVRFLIPYLEEKKIQYQLLATTGRAAKVLSNYTDYEARTIHSMIYDYKALNKDLSEVDDNTKLDNTGQIYIDFEAVQIESENRCVYIVDEASMISDEETKNITQAKFGTGKLLTELLEYDKNPQSKYVFIGDPCQLPPITSTISPALTPDYIRAVFKVGTQDAELTQIMRQSHDNDIITTAALLRNMYVYAPEDKVGYGNNRVWGKFPFMGKKNIVLHTSPQDLVNAYLEKLTRIGNEKAIYISRSNQQCSNISKIVRQRYGYRQSVCVGDLLMVIQNQNTTGLMNGDFVEVIKVGSKMEKTFDTSNHNYSISTSETIITIQFLEVRVRECFSKEEYSTLMITNTLVNGENLNSVQQSGLFLDFAIRMNKKGITQKKTPKLFEDGLSKDPFLNALRCSYGYAVTCHKAQGGEWDEVFVDIPRNYTLNPTKSTYQWMYTALTRAKQHFHCVQEFYIK